MDLIGIVSYNIPWYDYGSVAYLTYGQAGATSGFSGPQDLVSESGPISVSSAEWLNTPGGWAGFALMGTTTTVVFSSPQEQVSGKLGVRSSPANPSDVGVGTYANQQYTAWDQNPVTFK